MKILYISYDGMTDPLGQSQVIPYIIGLSDKGFEIYILSFEKKEKFKKNHTTIKSLCEKNNIKWHPLVYHKKPPIFSTLWDIYKMNKTALKLHKINTFNIVHCRSYISAFAGLKLQKKGIKFLFDMRGFWVDERVEGNLWDLRKFYFRRIYSFFKKKEIEFINKADSIVSLTTRAKEIILENENFSIASKKISVIPCCVDMHLFNPKMINADDLNAVKQKLNINDDDYIIGYVGSIGTWYMLDEMLSVFSKISHIRKEAKLLFITGEGKETIISNAKKYKISASKIIVTTVPHNKVPLYISVFNSSIFFIRPTFSKSASSPTKHGEIMAMGKPLICNSGIGDTDRIVSKSETGIVINLDHNQETKALSDFLNKDFDPTLIRSHCFKYFDLEKGIRTYGEIYNRLLNNDK